MENEQLWHSLRAQNIGGSEVADLFNQGFNSYFHLWHMKAGNVAPPDLSENEVVQAGNYLEDGIIKWANDKWNFALKSPGAYFKHPEIKGMACTPDAIDERDHTAMAQIKIMNGFVAGTKLEFDGDILIKAPLQYQLQCQHEMECAGKDTSELIILVNGMSLKRMTVFRDPELIDIIKGAVHHFWRSIEVGDEPQPDYKMDGPVLQELRKREVIAEEPIDWSGNNQMRHVADQYMEAAEKEKAGAAAKDAAKAEIMHNAMGGKKFLFGERSGDPRISIVTNQYGTSYPKVTRKK